MGNFLKEIKPKLHRGTEEGRKEGRKKGRKKSTPLVSLVKLLRTTEVNTLIKAAAENITLVVNKYTSRRHLGWAFVLLF